MEPTLPEYCAPISPFLYDVSLYFHSCVPTPLALVSTALGTLSIISWLFAQLPQIYKNYQLQSTAGLSVFFLVEWCMGDVTNLMGALFTNQATWQVIVATYYVFVDICLVLQYFWYTHLKRRIRGTRFHSPNCSDQGDDDSSFDGLSPITSNFTETTSFTSKMDDPDNLAYGGPTAIQSIRKDHDEKATSSPSRAITSHHFNKQRSSWDAAPSPRTILYVSTICTLISTTSASPSTSPYLARYPPTSSQSLLLAGTVLAWISTGLYLFSRLPQLYKNYSLRSTAGLSPLLFAAAFLGNFFYSTSLLSNPNAWHSYPAHGGHGWAGAEGNERWAWVGRAAPFFLGAAGVLGLDAAMGVQFLLYRERDEEKILKVRDSMGRTRWERVSGWMRGWVPTVVGKERIVAVEEGERLLSESRELQRSRYGSR